MKRLLSIITIFLLAFSISAQTIQKGVVKEYNEKDQKTPLEGVELKIRSANSTVSDKSGNFSLEFLTLKPGERVNVRGIEKLGYEVFNKEAIEQWNINPNTPFVVVMCRSDRFKKIRDNYQKVSSASYANQLKKETAALQRLKDEGKLKEAEYQKQLRELQENFDKQIDNLENYVDKFSRIDLSEIQPIEQEIIALVQEGRMDEAIAKYEAQNYVDKYIQEIEDIDEINSAMGQLTQIKEEKEQSKDSLLAAVSRYIDMLQLAGGLENNKKIYEVYRCIADRDTTNVDWLLKGGTFIRDYFADYETALSFFQKALNTEVSKFGEKNLTVAACYECIGSIYFERYDYKRSLDYCEKGLMIQSDILGVTHPDVAVSFNNIGKVYSRQGDYTRALEYHKIALNMRSEVQEDNHPDMANDYYSIGSVYSSLGDYLNALLYLEKALKIWLDRYGEDHPYSAAAYNDIGLTYLMQGKYQEALKYHERALHVRLEIYGENHPAVALSYNNIGGVYSGQGNYDDAIINYERSLKIRLNIFGDNHPYVAGDYNNIGSIFYYQGDYNKALDYFTKAISIQEDVVGRNHPDVATSYNNIGLVYTQKGDFSRALDSFERGLKILLNTFGDNHSLIATCYNNIGGVLAKQGEFEQALKNCEKALGIESSILGENHPNVAISIYNIGWLFSQMGDYVKALENYQKALKIKLLFLEDNHSDILVCYSSIYDAFVKLQNNEEPKRKEFEKFLADKVWVGSVAGEETPAAKLGLAGEYTICQFGDWNLEGNKDIMDTKSNLIGKPKDLVLYRDGKIFKHHFENQIGMNLNLKVIDPETKCQIEETYKKWKEE